LLRVWIGAEPVEEDETNYSEIRVRGIVWDRHE
jgi:hypothetical protein